MKMRIGEEMGALAERAVVKHKNYYSCSAAVLCAFRDSVGISETEAKRAAAPFAGGRMGKCGAVLASEYVLKQLYGADSAEKITEFERQFIARDKGSVM